MKRHLPFLIIMASLLWACADSVPFDENKYVVTQRAHQLSVDKTSIELPAVALADEALVITAEQTSWQITDVPEWITVSPTEGIGSGTITVLCAVNYAESPRQGTLTISSSDDEWPYSLSVSVTQQAHQYNTVSYKVGNYEMPFVLIDGGIFRMGSSQEESEGPVHEVELSNFSLMQTEVTQGLWKAVTGSFHEAGATASMPVCGVSWNDCLTFITRLRELTGVSFRLPTEAEWEFAARGGMESAGFTYSGSNVAADVAVTRNVSSALKEAKSLLPNELGLYDMSGNAYEWCQDYFGAYGSTSKRNPQGPTEGTERVIRGGSYAHDDVCARTTHRAGRMPETRSENIGFRFALDR